MNDLCTEDYKNILHTHTHFLFNNTLSFFFIRHFRLDMCRRQYANDACNRGTAGNKMEQMSMKYCDALKTLVFSRNFSVFFFSTQISHLFYTFFFCYCHFCKIFYKIKEKKKVTSLSIIILSSLLH